MQPASFRASIRALIDLAAGREPRPVPTTPRDAARLGLAPHGEPGSGVRERTEP
jgi:hypothetical protein